MQCMAQNPRIIHKCVKILFVINLSQVLSYLGKAQI
jgi:hypothetical protein